MLFGASCCFGFLLVGPCVVVVVCFHSGHPPSQASRSHFITTSSTRLALLPTQNNFLLVFPHFSLPQQLSHFFSYLIFCASSHSRRNTNLLIHDRPPPCLKWSLSLAELSLIYPSASFPDRLKHACPGLPLIIFSPSTITTSFSSSHSLPAHNPRHSSKCAASSATSTTSWRRTGSSSSTPSSTVRVSNRPPPSPNNIQKQSS